jgi:hypothetical protein
MIWIFVRRDYGALECADVRWAFGITQGTITVYTTTDGRHPHEHCRWFAGERAPARAGNLSAWSMLERLACPQHVDREMFPPKPRNFSIPALGDTFRSAALCCLPRRLSPSERSVLRTGFSLARSFARCSGSGIFPEFRDNHSRSAWLFFVCLFGAAPRGFSQLAEFRRAQRRKRQEGWAWFAVESLPQEVSGRVSHVHLGLCTY